MTVEIMEQKYQRPHSIKNIFWKKKKLRKVTDCFSSQKRKKAEINSL